MATKLSINDDLAMEKAVSYVLEFSKRLKNSKQIETIKQNLSVSDTNVLAANTLDFLFSNVSNLEDLKNRCDYAIKHFSSCKNKIAALAEKRIVKKVLY